MSQKTILVVEDDQDILNLIVEGLQELGFKVLSSTNPESVLKEINFKEVDCIVSDILMPKLDGVQLITAIKKLGFNPMVFFITGYRDYSRESLNILNPKAIIFKPFDIDEACLLIKSHLMK